MLKNKIYLKTFWKSKIKSMMIKDKIYLETFRKEKLRDVKK